MTVTSMYCIYIFKILKEQIKKKKEVNTQCSDSEWASQIRKGKKKL